MFNRKKQLTPQGYKKRFGSDRIVPIETGKKWKAMLVDGLRGPRYRSLRYIDCPDQSRIFIERIKDYGRLYVISHGMNPNATKVFAVAEDLRSAIIIANTRLNDIIQGN